MTSRTPSYQQVKFIFLVLNICILSQLRGQELNLELQITGRDSSETAIIDSISYQRSFKKHKALLTEGNTLQKKLEHIGYLRATQKKLVKKNDSLYTLQFFLNEKSKTLKITYNTTVFGPEIIKKISQTYTDTYFIIPFSNTEQTLNFLTKHLTNQGNTFSSLQLSDINTKNDTVFAQLNHQKSNERTIDNIVIKGYEKFPSNYLRHYSNIKKGQKFSKTTLLKKARSLNNLAFTSVTRAPEALFTKDSTSVYFYLSKKNANTFDGFIGFSNDEDNQKLVFDGYLNLNLINNLNFGETIRFIYKSDGNEQQRLQINTSLPYIFKTPLTLEAGLDIFKKDSTFLNTEQLINLHYTLGTKSDMYLGYKSSTSDNLLKTPQVGLDINSYDASYITGGFSYKIFQERPLFPIKTNLSLRTEIGNRNTTNNSNKQQKAFGDFSHILNLNSRNSIYFNDTFAILLSDTYIFNELYRFGGITSMRGFEENSLFASLYNVINTEYRFLLSSNLYIHSIIDYGYFEDKNNNLNDNLTSFGFGIGLNTKSGLFKINFANGKTSEQTFKFSNTKVHLSLVAFF